jgi:nitrogen fixation protein NifU and related proteins
MIYTDKVMDHFQNPRNVGVIKDADGVGQVGNPVCGDMMTFYIKVKDDRLADIKFQTFGCGAAIAVSSIVSEIAMGKTLEEAMKITNSLVAEELGGLPKNKLHCSNLGADALHAAIEDYRAKQRPDAAPAAPKVEHAHEESEEECSCPYCDEPLVGQGTEEYCRKCELEFAECPSCGELNKKGVAACIHCGQAMAK